MPNRMKVNFMDFQIYTFPCLVTKQCSDFYRSCWCPRNWINPSITCCTQSCRSIQSRCEIVKQVFGLRCHTFPLYSQCDWWSLWAATVYTSPLGQVSEHFFFVVWTIINSIEGFAWRSGLGWNPSIFLSGSETAESLEVQPWGAVPSSFKYSDIHGWMDGIYWSPMENLVAKAAEEYRT